MEYFQDLAHHNIVLINVLKKTGNLVITRFYLLAALFCSPELTCGEYQRGLKVQPSVQSSAEDFTAPL